MRARGMLVKQHVHVWYTHARVRMVLYFSSVFFFCIYFHSSSVPFYLHLSHSLCAILWTCLFVAFSYRLLRGAVRCDRIIIRARTRWRAIAAAAKRIRDSTRRDHRTAPMILVCTIMYAVYRMLCYPIYSTPAFCLHRRSSLVGSYTGRYHVEQIFTIVSLWKRAKLCDLRGQTHLKIVFFVAFSKKGTIQNYIFKILLRNSKNWLSYS